jgi:glycosyltransferase involved in cell wall biosynthesis
MRILFAGKQHYDVGGIPADTRQLARRLVAAGHEVAVLAHAPYDRPTPGWPARMGVRREPGFEYPAFSTDLMPPALALQWVARRFRPDVLVVLGGGRWYRDWSEPLLRTAPRSLPTVFYIQDTEACEILDDPRVRIDAVLANASYHAASVAQRGRQAGVVPAVIEPELYRVAPTGEVALFINPIVSKGVETAFALAERRRDIPFEFRMSWAIGPRDRKELVDRAARLGNVVVLDPTVEPAECYGRARLLVVPYEDMGLPRVVAEAQISGIPVLARDDPPLREAVGPGGILVGAEEGIDGWVAGLGRLWDDPSSHTELAAAAREHSERDERKPNHIVARFVAEMDDAIAGRRRMAAPRHRVAPSTATVPAAGRESAGDLPLPSVILPVRNEEADIERQLAALAGQTYQGPWELVVSDNGSTDGTVALVERWRDRLPALTVVDASGRRGVAHARNVGLRAAAGDVLLICDGDDEVAPDWIEVMVQALEEHGLVTGFADIVTRNSPEQYEWTGDATRTDAEVGYGYMRYASGGNLGMWREVFEGLAGFDETLRRAEDIDFSWRAAYMGIPVHFEPRAVIHQQLRTSARDLMATAFRGGMAEPGLYRRHRRRGMAQQPLSEVLELYGWIVRVAPAVLTGRRNRYPWASNAGRRIGRIVGSVRHRVVYL